MRIVQYSWMFLLLLLGSCESLEDTYSDYTGDGVIRYLGKCTDVTVRPGWQRLIVNWVNNVDPTIDKIKITYKLNDVVRDTLVDKTVTECSLPRLQDGNYEVTVCSVDKEGNTSLGTPVFARPYTENHETVRSFTRLISKHYFVKDRLVLFFSDWTDDIEEAFLEYYNREGMQQLPLSKELIEQRYFLLPEAIDIEKGVVLKRKGHLEGCEDLIVFSPYKLSTERLYTTDFKLIARERYGQTEITNDFIQGLKEIEFDYSLTSFEDILNCPNLEKLILGKNRYLDLSRVDVNETYSELSDLERSRFVLEVAHEVLGLKVERYNQHYFPGETFPYMKEMGNPELPTLDYLDTKGWTFTCSEKDEYPYDAHLERLFDGSFSNWWQPEALNVARVYEIIVDMQEMLEIKGVRVAQRSFDVKDDFMSSFLLPNMIKMEVSENKLNWEDATFVIENTLGVSSGESTLLYLKTPKSVRYLKFIVNDQVYSSNFSVSLAELAVF